jgi:beta-aspartyl-dipeptidase (metallo-type)
LSEFTTAGVTTVVGVLGTDDVTRSTENLLAAVRRLNEEGITARCHTGGYHVPPVTLTGSVARDIVNIDVVIGVGEVAISDHRSSQPTLAELLRIASEAHVAGLMTEKAGIVHLHVGDGPAGLEPVRAALEAAEIPPRVYNPTHVNRRKALFEESLELAARGCSIDVTSFPVAEGEDAWPAERAVELFWENGDPTDRITVSSDGGGCFPEFDHDGRVTGYDIGSSASLTGTIAALVNKGHPLDRVLPPFTSNPARLLRLGGKGKIRTGADADLVVVEDGFRIISVMSRGTWYVRDGELQIRGTFE